MIYSEEERKNKLRDIEAIDFGNSVSEITASLEIVLTLFQFDDDKDIIIACKHKLEEGVKLLKKCGADSEANQFQP